MNTQEDTPALKASEVTRIRLDFIKHMDTELAANEPRKGDFAKFRFPMPESAVNLMEEHIAKLYHALALAEPARVREHCADVANIAMKIDECYGSEGTATKLS